ncbi:MAG: glycosyltransferase family 2 protein [Mucilaginibacter sp.]
MENVCVLIRVYNRIEDLRHTVEIIRNTWTLFNYHIIVVANGKKKGFVVDAETRNKVDLVIELEENAGHLLGNSQLLLNGVPAIPNNCKYTVILEADTWLYKDVLIKKYVDKLNHTGNVWASARWYDKLFSVATDIAVIQTQFIKTEPQVFEFSVFPEYYIAEYLIDHHKGYTFITENMPVHLPGYIKNYPYTTERRFNVYPKSKMVTHHFEDLPGGLEEKKFLFNAIVGQEYFKIDKRASYTTALLKIKLAIITSYLLPKRNWFFKYRKINESDLLYLKQQTEQIANRKEQ